MKILVTGAAGFIGFHTAAALLARGDTVIGLDNLNDYYDVALKEARLARLVGRPGFRFQKTDIADRTDMAELFQRERPGRVVHLAAQAGVRYSIDHPHAYADANLTGFLNILEGCRQCRSEHLVYASSSSVYGANTQLPFRLDQSTDHPVSLYGATKKANELMAHAYAHLYGLPVTGLRFFTVYGPWGRPDMAVFKFARQILAGEEIHVFNGGAHARDLTYIDDIVEGIVRTLDRPAAADPHWTGAAPEPATSSAPYRIYNIGNSSPVPLTELISELEGAFQRKARQKLLPMQPGDVLETYADVQDLVRDTGFRPDTPLAAGIAKFAAWYQSFYGP